MLVRKKPVTVEAMQLTGSSSDQMEVYHWVEENTSGSFDPLSDEVPASGVSIDPATGFMLIATLEGVMQAKTGWWVIRGVKGEFYPCDPEIFEATYELVDDTETENVKSVSVAMSDPYSDAYMRQQALDHAIKLAHAGWSTENVTQAADQFLEWIFRPLEQTSQSGS